MKFLKLLAILLLTSSTVAWADGLDLKPDWLMLQYEYRTPYASAPNPLATKPNSNGAYTNIGKYLDDGHHIAIDVGLEGLAANGQTTTATFGRIDTGLTLSYNGFFLRSAVGEKFTSTTKDGFYSIEPGYKYTINDKWKVWGSYRYRTEFNDAYHDDTNTVKAGVIYSIDNKTDLGVTYLHLHGDSTDQNGVNVGFTWRF